LFVGGLGGLLLGAENLLEGFLQVLLVLTGEDDKVGLADDLGLGSRLKGKSLGTHDLAVVGKLGGGGELEEVGVEDLPGLLGTLAAGSGDLNRAGGVDFLVGKGFTRHVDSRIDLSLVGTLGTGLLGVLIDGEFHQPQELVPHLRGGGEVILNTARLLVNEVLNHGLKGAMLGQLRVEEVKGDETSNEGGRSNGEKLVGRVTATTVGEGEDGSERVFRDAGNDLTLGLGTAGGSPGDTAENLRTEKVLGEELRELWAKLDRLADCTVATLAGGLVKLLAEGTESANLLGDLAEVLVVAGLGERVVADGHTLASCLVEGTKVTDVENERILHVLDDLVLLRLGVAGIDRRGRAGGAGRHCYFYQPGQV